MIGLDTNVVVRYLAQDEPDQSATASTVIDALTENDSGVLSLVTVVELHWVLRRAYKTAPLAVPSWSGASSMPASSGSTRTRSSAPR